MEVSTSVLTVKKDNCIKTFYNLEAAGTDYFHIDVMDGKFVEDDTSALMKEYCEYLNSITNVPLDVHLMVSDVMSYINSYLVYEPRCITVHYEEAKDREQLMNWINYIKENNIKVGISVKPQTDIKEIYELLPYIHVVLIMTVEPGKGGQALIPDTIEKISKLNEYRQQNNLEFDIEADGGINSENIEKMREAGCDIVVAGTYIVNSENYKEAINSLK